MKYVTIEARGGRYNVPEEAYDATDTFRIGDVIRRLTCMLENHEAEIDTPVLWHDIVVTKKHGGQIVHEYSGIHLCAEDDGVEV